MQSERSARLAQAVAAMPAGPSRDRFQLLLDELATVEGGDWRTPTGDADGEGADVVDDDAFDDEADDEADDAADDAAETDEVDGGWDDAVDTDPEGLHVPYPPGGPASAPSEAKPKRRWLRRS